MTDRERTLKPGQTGAGQPFWIEPNTRDDATSDMDGCIDTFEKCEARLSAVEQVLAKRFDLQGNIRPQLLALDQANELEEDHIVSDWHAHLSSYLDWKMHPEHTPTYTKAVEAIARKLGVEFSVALDIHYLQELQTRIVQCAKAHRELRHFPVYSQRLELMLLKYE